MKLTKKMVLGFSLILVIFSAILLFVVQSRVTNMVSDSYMKSVKANAKLGYYLLDSKYEGEWEIRDNRFFKGETLMNGNYMVIDAMLEDTGYCATIFMKDVRVATNLFTEKGESLVGSKASPGIVVEVLKKGQEYSGITTIAGKEMYAYYIPLINQASNEVVGMWFVGIEKSRVNEEINRTTLFIGLIILVMLICGIAFSYILGSKMIGRIKELTGFASAISRGDLTGKDVVVNSKDEIRILADAFNNMKNSVLSIVKRIDEIGFNVQISSKELNESIQQNFLVCNEISTAMQDVAKDSELLAIETGNISKMIEETYNALDRISEQPEDTRNEVFEGIVKLKVWVLNIAESSKKIHYASERFAATGEEILVSTEEQVASYEDIVDTSGKLSANAEEMGTMVKKFKTVQ